MIAVLGWSGSLLVLVSLAQRNAYRFRVLNLIASLILIVFNIATGLVSMIVLNVAVAIVNIHHLSRMEPSASGPHATDVEPNRSGRS